MGSTASKAVPSVSSATAHLLQVQEKQSYLSAPSPYVSDDEPVWASVPVDALASWSSKIDNDPSLQLSRLVLSNSDPVQTLISRKALIKDAKVFNLTLKGEYPGPRVNQASSGRCWLFATTNVLRYNVVEVLGLGDFQLSQSYLFFYDKLEKANYYLENVLQLVDEPLEGRLMTYLNGAPVNDGGQWDMAVNIIEKYGVIPQTLYPESWSSSASSRLDSLLTSKLREYGLILRAASPGEARKLKSRMMSEVFTALSITLGSPPKPTEKLTWEYYDKAGKFHSWTGTPVEFYGAFAKRKGMQPKSSFSLINDPRNSYETLYTVQRLGNVWGGRPVQYVNAPIEALEDAVIAGIKANTPLFFGCDVGKCSNTKEGVMDCELYNLKLAYGFNLGMNKAQRLESGESSMTHAMVITAVHVDDNGRPVRYKVENSWSESAGEKGWFMMTAQWFREYVYQVVIPRSVADKKWTAVLEGGKAVVLKPWDPMVS
ncbi:hypothetical protein M231_01994 [Tremella mesenterica]|uniref:Cysteine proteinase 1, mitochondrial n=1 Tax=Tremella mesenterica TaxID=5217 RepID=A0A4Q1BS39_TREME|nr:hypothetical protein M231_01994 [Tremella mesenterica]